MNSNLSTSDTDQISFYVKTQTYLVCLLPLSLIFSIFLADLIIVILFFSFLISCLKNNNFLYFNNKYFKFFFAYWIYIVLLSFFSDNFFDSIKSSFTYIRFLILPLIILYLSDVDKNFLKNFLYSLLIAFFLLIFDGFYEFFFGKNIFGYGNIEKGRLVSFFKDEYVLGSYLGKLFFLVASLWFVTFGSKDHRKNLYFVIFYILSFSIIFLSGDRMPFLLFLLGSIIFLILSNYNYKLKLAFIFLSIMTIILTLIIHQPTYDRFIKKTLLDFGSEKGLTEGGQLYKFKLDSGREITFLTQHINYFIVSYNIFKENPIFGKGNKGFKNNCNKHKIDCCSCSSHPHNIYAQLLVENGIIGFLFFVAIFLWISYIFLIQILKKIKNDHNNILSNSRLCILICIYLNLWPFAQTGNLFNNWQSIIYFLPVGIFLNDFNVKNNKIKIN